MSVCNCPILDSNKQKELIKSFMEFADDDWNLLSIVDMYNAGNNLETIESVIPFRGGPCSRSIRCCGMCTRQCYTRCIQDCLHRLYMWRKLVETTPEVERDRIPMGIRYIVTQKFKTLEDLSWTVGEILSRNSNTNLKEYMQNANLRPEENPYKIDYSPQVDRDPVTGKRCVDPRNGKLRILSWPRTGLCPYCLPNVTVDGRIARRAQHSSSSG